MTLVVIGNDVKELMKFDEELLLEDAMLIKFPEYRDSLAHLKTLENPIITVIILDSMERADLGDIYKPDYEDLISQFKLLNAKIIREIDFYREFEIIRNRVKTKTTSSAEKERKEARRVFLESLALDKK
jgi:hypothetical protein